MRLERFGYLMTTKFVIGPASCVICVTGDFYVTDALVERFLQNSEWGRENEATVQFPLLGSLREELGQE